MDENEKYAEMTAEMLQMREKPAAEPEMIPETFTQEDVNRVVSDRLERERRNFKDFEQLRTLLFGLRQRGVLSADSIGGQVEELTALAENRAAEPSETDAGDSAPVDPDSFADPCPADAAASEPPADMQREASAPSTDAVLAPVSADAELADLVQDPMFPKFAKGKNIPFSELVEDFRDLLRMSGRTENGRRGQSRADNPDPAEQALRQLRSMPVCRMAGSRAAPPLSERQKEIARSGGMSYEEYYELIREIPERKGRRFVSERPLP